MVAAFLIKAIDFMCFLSHFPQFRDLVIRWPPVFNDERNRKNTHSLKGCHEQIWIAEAFEIEFSSGFGIETRQHLIEDVEVGLALGPPHHTRLFQHQSLNRRRHNLTGSVEIDAHQLRKSEIDLNSYFK